MKEYWISTILNKNGFRYVKRQRFKVYAKDKKQANLKLQKTIRKNYPGYKLYKKEVRNDGLVVDMFLDRPSRLKNATWGWNYKIIK